MTGGRKNKGGGKRGAAIALRRAIGLGATALGGVVVPQMAVAQQAQELDFAIAAGPLGDALIAFGRQSGLQVSVSTEEIRVVTSPGVSGRMTAAAAIGRLLADTGFTWRQRGTLVTIERLPFPATVDTITTDALRVEGQQTVGTGSARDAGGHDDVFDRDA